MTYLETSIDQTAVKELLKHPPDALHKPRIQSLVILLEVYPSTETMHYVLRKEKQSKV